MNVLNALRDESDIVYRDFCSRLIPNLSTNLFLGVRTPILRKTAKDLIKNDEYRDFISILPHTYFEENQLHAFILSEIRDFNIVIHETERFLPYVNNWATCDQMSPKVFAKNSDKLLPHIKKWINSKDVYTVRFAVLCLMRYFLDDKFDTKYSDMVANIKSDEYYVNMVRAWYFATAVAKQYDNILPYFSNKKLDNWTYKCAIQKALESCRVSSEHKQILRLLK